MAPATRGCVFELGGKSLLALNLSLIVSTSFSKVARISLNFLIIVALMASRAGIRLKLCSMSNAPLAERRLRKDSLMKLLASSSISFTSC